MIVFPGVKINIGLSVINKRKDGFHNIESCFYPIDFGDILEIIESNQMAIEISGIAIPNHPSSNLVVKAYELLKQDFDLPPVSIYLHKISPIGAGLGGGSADGGFALKALNELFKLSIDKIDLENYAAQLGSDCPFFIDNKVKFVSGRGEIMKEINLSLKGKWLHMIHSDLHISTVKAYEGITTKEKVTDLVQKLSLPIQNWDNHITNAFEIPVFKMYDNLKQIKNKLYAHGALYASMTGTGSTIYGIFENEPKAIDEKIKQTIIKL